MGRRLLSVLGTLIFLVIAPGFVAGVVPWWISGWHMQPPLLGVVAFRFAGVLLIAVGVPVILDSFARFALQGLGTPLPLLPTKHLVVKGLYRFVRNPMYVGVVTVVLGQGLLLGETRVLGYGALVWALFFAFVLAYEEPTLHRTFGAEYEEFRRNVPRWIPRWRR